MKAMILVLVIAALPVGAHAWDPFLSENDNVERGNSRMAANDPEGALAAYDAAARELPNEPRIPLNRGLAAWWLPRMAAPSTTAHIPTLIPLPAVTSTRSSPTASCRTVLYSAVSSSPALSVRVEWALSIQPTTPT